MRNLLEKLIFYRVTEPDVSGLGPLYCNISTDVTNCPAPSEIAPSEEYLMFGGLIASPAPALLNPHPEDVVFS